MSARVALPEGQSADYRIVLADGAGLHVKEFGTRYEAHIDEVHPEVNVIEHLRKDAPTVLISSGAALGALIGRAVGFDALLARDLLAL